MSGRAHDAKSRERALDETARHWKRTKSLAAQAQWINVHVDATVCLTRVLFSDEDFLIALRAESLSIMPSFLRRLLENGEVAPVNGPAQTSPEILLKCKRTCRARAVAELKDVPGLLAEDSLRLVVVAKYFEVLLSNHQINRFLQKHHAGTLPALENLLREVRDHRYTAA